jgi:hypothetical protein
MQEHTEQTFKSRALAALRRELREYGVVSLYLYLYFFALLMYKDSVLREHGMGYAPYGLAIIKAVVIGKFVLLGQGMRVGHRSHGMALIWHLLHKVVAFVALLFVLTAIEDVILSLIHHHSLHEALGTITAEPWQQVVAMSLLGCLALTPFFGLQEIVDTMGSENFRRMMFTKRS